MGEIKSALEIALERTKSVEGNKDIVEADRYRKEGKQRISKFFDDTGFNLMEGLKGYDKKQMNWVGEGMVHVLLANLVLPLDQLGLKKLRRVGEAFFAISKNPKHQQSIFSQLDSFFAEYLEEKGRLREGLVAQYTPRLKQKEQELSKKMGMPVNIDIENDPEFNAVLRKTVSKMDEKYQSVLDQVKKDLSATRIQ